MAKGQLKIRFQKLKEKGREEQQKIKKLVIKRKDDVLTALEKNWRDWAFRPLTDLFQEADISANQITYTGFIFVAIAVWLFLKEYPLTGQLVFLILAGITDGIDGPTARNNNNVTIRGTWLDHLRDGFLVGWTSYLIYRYGLLSLEMIMIIWALQFLLIWLTLKDFAMRYLKELSEEEGNLLISHFSLDNLQASILGRIQFFCWTTGYLILLASLLWPSENLVSVGQSLIVLEIIFAALNISESYQKSI